MRWRYADAMPAFVRTYDGIFLFGGSLLFPTLFKYKFHPHFMITCTSHSNDERNAEVNDNFSVKSSASLLLSQMSAKGSANEEEVWQHAS